MRKIDMLPAQDPTIISYPTTDGKGGVGYTAFYPIVASYLALDTWPEHRGAILVVCSCKPYDPAIPAQALAAAFRGEVESTEIQVDLLKKGMFQWGEFL